jgi:hypothetical protein
MVQIAAVVGSQHDCWKLCLQTVTASLSSTLKNSKLVADYDASINTFKGEKRCLKKKKNNHQFAEKDTTLHV